MNIFALSYCPAESAQWQHDKHVVKMLLETAQILSTNAILVPEWREKCENITSLYVPSYVNHPCTKWARQTLGNFRWLCEHGRELWKEYDFRFGGIHKSYSAVIEPLRELAYVEFNYGDVKMTPFPQAMPVNYKIPGNSVQAYRDYYVGEKIMTDSNWTGCDRIGELPSWLSSEIL